MVSELKWTSVTSNEVEKANYRLEASAFNVDAKKAIDDLKRCKHKLKPLIGKNGFGIAYRPGIVKRIFVNEGFGIPMFTPSEIVNINPKPEKFLSKHTKTNLDEWKLKEEEIVLTCSGTIGQASYVSKTLAGKCFSQNMIRIVANEYPGYLYAFIKTKTCQLLLQTNNYGAVIQHIDPEHLENISVPNPPADKKKSIDKKIIDSFNLRDESNRLFEKAESILKNSLKLPSIYKIDNTFFDNKATVQTFIVNISNLDDRFDASYHIPLVNSIFDYLLDNSDKILPLRSKELSSAVLHPERFKRVYVDENDGVPFFGGKGLLSIDPTGKKYISKSKHSNRIPGLILKKNMLLLTRSGTIGKVNIVPQHWDGWIATDDLIRVVPASNEIAGFLYVWLASDYGRVLIEKFVYGSVVDHIEVDHVGKIPIPILKDKSIMKQINDLALEANKLRSEAYDLEQAAIKQVNEEVIFG